MAAGRRKVKLSKEAILAKAKELFSKKGYNGTTINDLTSIFGVSKPSIYYYFKSKIEILLELHSTGLKEATKHMDELVTSDIPTKEKFRLIIDRHIRNTISDIKLIRVFYLDEAEMPKKVTDEIRKRRRESTKRIVAIFDKGKEEGIFKDIDSKQAVYMILGACNWLIMWYDEKKYQDPELIVKNLMTILCEGYEVNS